MTSDTSRVRKALATFVQDAIDKGATTVEDIHKSIADLLPLRMLERSELLVVADQRHEVLDPGAIRRERGQQRARRVAAPGESFSRHGDGEFRGEGVVAPAVRVLERREREERVDLAGNREAGEVEVEPAQVAEHVQAVGGITRRGGRTPQTRTCAGNAAPSPPGWRGVPHVGTSPRGRRQAGHGFRH
jgi:hypothetical protein